MPGSSDPILSYQFFKCINNVQKKKTCTANYRVLQCCYHDIPLVGREVLFQREQRSEAAPTDGT